MWLRGPHPVMGPPVHGACMGLCADPSGQLEGAGAAENVAKAGNERSCSPCLFPQFPPRSTSAVRERG